MIFFKRFYSTSSNKDYKLTWQQTRRIIITFYIILLLFIVLVLYIAYKAYYWYFPPPIFTPIGRTVWFVPETFEELKWTFDRCNITLDNKAARYMGYPLFRTVLDPEYSFLLRFIYFDHPYHYILVKKIIGCTITPGSIKVAIACYEIMGEYTTYNLIGFKTLCWDATTDLFIETVNNSIRFNDNPVVLNNYELVRTVTTEDFISSHKEMTKLLYENQGETKFKYLLNNYAEAQYNYKCAVNPWYPYEGRAFG